MREEMEGIVVTFWFWELSRDVVWEVECVDVNVDVS